ncbi:hypothetical protein CVIRNUC_003779 [Coccomyxa viridis]|uniref:Uncharacterized protein n=1 Tax=Coccomyxa viridis TaxID=1274662 RepID=A0AAV1I3V6_9CHLO|nr:hypothetical protein CVIRNUC_003779 [Coccomyxa viridis]
MQSTPCGSLPVLQHSQHSHQQKDHSTCASASQSCFTRLRRQAPQHLGQTYAAGRLQQPSLGQGCRSRSRLHILAAEKQGSPTTTKKRTTGPPILPPINDNSGGGGGGGGDKFIRNVALNLILLGAYFVFESFGDGGGFFGGGGGDGGGDSGGGGGGGGGDGTGGGGNSGPQGNHPEISTRDLPDDEEEEQKKRRKAAAKRRKRQQAEAQAKGQLAAA